MTVWDAQPLAPSRGGFAGGQAPLVDLFGAADDLQAYVDNTLAADDALEEAYDRRIAAIRKATGQELKNPLRLPTRFQRSVAGAIAGGLGGPLPELEDEVKPRAEHEADFARSLGDLDGRFPDARRDIRARVPVKEDAIGLARQAEDRLGRMMASRRDVVAPYAAAFAGGALGSLRDPVQVATLFVGGGAGGAKTVAGRILQTALREAVVNGATEAAMQPLVQAWRQEAGLEHGWTPALKNVAFATGLGAGFGAAGRGIGEGVGAALRPTRADRLARVIVDGLEDGPLARGLDGDVTELAARFQPYRPSLRPETRGALDALELDGAIDPMRRPSTSPDAHAAVLDGFTRAAEDPSHLPAAIRSLEQPPPPGTAPRAPRGAPAATAFGPLLRMEDFPDGFAGVVARMRAIESGDAPGALSHPEIGPIDVIWGGYDAKTGEGGGLAKIVAKHPEVVAELPELLPRMTVESRSANRVVLDTPDRRAVVRLDYDGASKTWLLSAYGKKGRRGGDTTERPAGRQADTSSASPADGHIGENAPALNRQETARLTEPFEPAQAEAQTQVLAQELAEQVDMAVPLGARLDADGNVGAAARPLGEALEEIERGNLAARLVEACRQ